jgi:hypothetical protein
VLAAPGVVDHSLRTGEGQFVDGVIFHFSGATTSMTMMSAPSWANPDRVTAALSPRRPGRRVGDPRAVSHHGLAIFGEWPQTEKGGSTPSVTGRSARVQQELLDRTLVWNQRHLMIMLREYEDF